MPGFNLRKILQEAAETQKTGGECELDAIMTDTDLKGMLDEINPITGEVAGKLHEGACDPNNIRIVMDESGQYYVDYNEMVNYCEATGKSVKDAADSIVEFYQSNGYDNFTIESYNIVFPSKSTIMEACEKASCGKVGYNSDVLWSSHFLADCKNVGLKCTSFIDPGVSKNDVK